MVKIGEHIAIKWLTGIILIFWVACENRDWNNPFDPECPKEIFTPTNFTAIQEGEQVILSWNQTNPNITGFKIEKQVENESFTDIASPVKNENSTTNTISAGGKLHTYKLYALAGSNKSNEVTATITPVLQATITTKVVTGITATSAISGGTITDDGGGPVTARGVVWSKTANPTLENNLGKTNNGTGTGTFTSELTNLDNGTTYYVRAYATNSEGIEYGDEITFTTHEEKLPSVNTFVPQNIIPGAATLGGEVTSAGVSEIIERGVCWATNPSPTIEDNRAVFQLFGSDGIESYSREITGFLANTTYYARAYAKNSNGTAYGQEESWTTSPEIALPTVTTNEPESITTNSAVLGGHVDNTGGTFVTEWGVVYGTSSNPTIDHNKFVIQDTEINGGSGSIGVTINELNAGTNYYVRAYAINSKGTGYGEQKSFTTEQDLNGETGTFTDSRDGNIYKWVKIGEQIWMAENLAYLPSVSPPSISSSSESYYYVFGYNNSVLDDAKLTTNYEKYGVLYNYPASVKACPNGWHLPSDGDWKKLELFIGMDQDALSGTGLRGKDEGNLLKSEIGWNNNGGGTNNFGFDAIPGGLFGSDSFLEIGEHGHWWSSTESVGSIYSRSLHFDNQGISRSYTIKDAGLSIRCIKD